MTAYDDFETLLVLRPESWVLHVIINRPAKRNAMNARFWIEFRECFERISRDADVRVITVSGAAMLGESINPARGLKLHRDLNISNKLWRRDNPLSLCSKGDHFSAGLDLEDTSNFDAIARETKDVARRAFRFRKLAKTMQESFSSIECCPQPVIAALHGACVGGAVDLACACDIRFCSQDAKFCIAEVKVGLAADVGTLQRMPRIVGNESLCRELAYTGRTFGAAEAARMGLVSKVLGPGSRREEVVQASLMTAAEIARQSPVAVFGTKRNLIYGRDHSIEDGLEYAATWNGAALQAEDLRRAMGASLPRKNSSKALSHPGFSKL